MLNTHPTMRALCLLLVIFVAPLALLAQPESKPPTAVTGSLPEPGWFFEFETYASHGSEASWDEAEDLTATTATFHLGGGVLKRFDNTYTQIGLNVSYSAVTYDFEQEMDETIPFDRTNQMMATLTIGQPLNRDWAIVGLFQTEAAWARDSEIEEGLNYVGFVGVLWRISPDLNVTVGAIGIVRPEDDNTYLPIASFEWQLTEEFRLYSYNGVYAEWDFSANPLFGLLKVVELSAEYNSTTFDLDEAPAVDSLPERQALEIAEVALGASASIDLTEELDFVLFAAAVPWQEWTWRFEEEESGTWERDFFYRVGARLAIKF